MSATSTFVKGRLEDAFTSRGVDEVEEFLALKSAVGDYRLQFLEVESALAEETARFVRAYVLGGSHKKSLHDERVKTMRVDYAAGDATCRIEISLPKRKGKNCMLRVVYSGVSAVSFHSEDCAPIISGHEVIWLNSGYQHNIYLVGDETIKVRSRYLSYFVELVANPEGNTSS